MVALDHVLVTGSVDATVRLWWVADDDRGSTSGGDLDEPGMQGGVETAADARLDPPRISSESGESGDCDDGEPLVPSSSGETASGRPFVSIN